MYTADITLATKTFALTTQRTLSSVRSMAGEPVSEPNYLTISHENANSGRRSSVVILEDVKVVSAAGAVVPVKDSLKMMFKVQYNPFSGRTTTEADITAMVAQLVAFINTPANITKLLNQES